MPTLFHVYLHVDLSSMMIHTSTFFFHCMTVFENNSQLLWLFYNLALWRIIKQWVVLFVGCWRVLLLLSSLFWCCRCSCFSLTQTNNLVVFPTLLFYLSINPSIRPPVRLSDNSCESLILWLFFFTQKIWVQINIWETPIKQSLWREILESSHYFRCSIWRQKKHQPVSTTIIFLLLFYLLFCFLLLF